MINFTNMKVAKNLSKRLDPENPQPVYEQLHELWSYDDFKIYNWTKTDGAILVYRGGDALYEISRAKLRDETIILFPYSWMVTVQPDGKYVVTKYL